jgi:hypothetical protein
MKKLALITVASLMVATCAFAQGTINFNTRVGSEVVVQVFMPDGTTPLDGAGFTAQLFGGPAGSDAGSLVALTPTTIFRSGAGAGFVVAAGDVAVTGVPGGQSAAIQMRVWENMGGTIASYADAVSAGAFRGESNVFDSPPLGDLTAIPPSVSPNLVGMQSFNLVPEPTTYALLALGAGALLFRRRKTA